MTRSEHNLQWSDLMAKEPEPIPKPNYNEEVTLYFYNIMLGFIIDSWESVVDDKAESIPSGHNVIKSKPYERVCDEELELNLPVKPSETSVARKSSTYRSDTTSTLKTKRSSKHKFKKHVKTESTKYASVETVEESKLTMNDIPEEEPSDWFVNCVDENIEVCFKNGNRYKGPIHKLLMHGVGMFHWGDGTNYAGEFQNGHLTGKGEMFYRENSRYKGHFLNGLRHGIGDLIVCKAPHIYNGNWYRGRKHGKGWLLYAAENWYKGEWKNDYMDGIGLRQYPSGSRYYGNWSKGLRHGFGCAILKNCDFFAGNWRESLRHGYGEYIWKSFLNLSFSVPPENRYIGSWRYNLRQGVGIIYFGMNGGSRFAGVFERNQKHGAGVLICENGTCIASNPLFEHDKPIHVSESGELKFDIRSELHLNTPNISCCDVPLYSNENSMLNIIAKQAQTMSDNLDNETLAYIEKCNLKFPAYEKHVLSLRIPVSIPSENIPVDYFLNLVIQAIDHDCLYGCMPPMVINAPVKLDVEKITQSSDSPHGAVRHLNTPESPGSWKTLNCSFLLLSEEKWIRRIIAFKLTKLRKIYEQYAAIVCFHHLPFKPLMTRLFLWQLYRDCKLHTKGLTLFDIDELLYKNPNTYLDTRHSPFEIIYFWQFLHSLISVAWKLYGHTCLKQHIDGILRNAFLKFYKNDLEPNVGKHRGKALFDYRDLLPIEHVYDWYLSLGECHTVLQFLRNASTIRQKSPTISELENKPSTVCLIDGVNVLATGMNFIYLEADAPQIQTTPIEEVTRTSDEDKYRDYKLLFFREVSAKKIMLYLHEFFPRIRDHKNIINLKIPLSFLEFYELLLLCAETVLKRRFDIEEKIRSAEEKERLLELELFQFSQVSTAIKTRRRLHKSKSQMKSKSVIVHSQPHIQSFRHH